MGHPVLPVRVLSFLLWFCVFTHVLDGTGKSKKDITSPLQSLQHVEILNPSHASMESLRLSKALSVVYYFNAVETPSRQSFLNAFDDSAEYLKVYNINLVVVNCLESSIPLEECKQTNIIATYQNGVELIKLDIDTMFDVNSIMANSMQLLLLREVPILESQGDRESLQANLLGKQDLIFFYTRAIGTREHRFFLEIAHTYQHQYKFAVSTRLETSTGLSDADKVQANSKYAMWTCHCSKALPPQPTDSSQCASALYRGSVSLHAFDNYLERLPQPNLFYAPENGTTSLFEIQGDLPHVFIYTNNALKKHSGDISHSLSFDLKGFAKVVVVDIDDKECVQIASSQGFDGHVPRVAIAVPDGNLTFMEKKEELILSEIKHFLITVATVHTEPGEEIVNATDRPVTWGPKYEEIVAVEVQDDEVAKAVFKEDRERPELTQVPSVLKDTFGEIVQEARLKLVVYYSPYDAVSLAFLNHFDDAAKILNSEKNTQNILARVNCYDATDLCARENVATYPVIRIHRKNLPYQMYEGPLNTKSIVRAVGLLIHEFPRPLQKEEELKAFIRGEYPTEVKDVTSTSVVFMAKHEDKASWNLFKNASHRLLPFVAMGEVQGHLINSLTHQYSCPPPCVLSFHHHDAAHPVRTMAQFHLKDPQAVVQFVKQATILAMPELTADNFPILHSKKLPFVILFLNQSNPESSQVKTAFSQIASRDIFSESIFCWMDAQNQTIGRTLLKEYTQDVTVPLIAVVNHKLAKVFSHDVRTLSANQMDQWLTNVFNGQEEPTKMLSDKKWSAPGPHYDFLKFIDEELEEALEEEERAAERMAASAIKLDLGREEEGSRSSLDHQQTHGDFVSVSERTEVSQHEEEEGSGGENKNDVGANKDQTLNSHTHGEL